MNRVQYTEKAREDLKKLELRTAQRIIKKIHHFELQKNPLKFAKKLTKPSLGEFRFRIGAYRAIFDTNKHGQITILSILRIKHRKDIYDL